MDTPKGDHVTHPIVNLSACDVAPLPAGIAPTGEATERYAPQVAMVGYQLGTERLGFNLIALAPGKRAFPFHSHRTNEEAFLVLAGSGEVRIGEARHPIREGDLIAAKAGGPETAHQIINTGDVELRYLAISTREVPDLIQYPDTGKFRVIDPPRGGDPGFDVLYGRDGPSDYWKGE